MRTFELITCPEHHWPLYEEERPIPGEDAGVKRIVLVCPEPGCEHEESPPQ